MRSNPLDHKSKVLWDEFENNDQTQQLRNFCLLWKGLSNAVENSSKKSNCQFPDQYATNVYL